jgi:sugar phosphate isomerase/epimerase
MKPSITRRALLGGAAAFGMVEQAARGNTAAEALADFKLGIATYSLREFSRGLAIRMIKDLGVTHVSVKEFHLPYRSTPEELAEGAKDFENAGVKIASGGMIDMLKDDDADIQKCFEYAKACGMPLMTIAPTHSTLPRIERFVKEYDIKVAVHNHGPEDEHFPSPEVALKALKGMDARMGVCIDVGHTFRTGTNAVDSVRAAGGRLLDLHIKDLRVLTDPKTEVPVGEGAVPVVALFQELKKMGYRGCVNLECDAEGDNPMPGMAKSFACMRGVLAGLRG